MKKQIVVTVGLLAFVSAAMADSFGWSQQVNELVSSFRVTAKQEDAVKQKSDAVRLQASQAQASTMVDIFNREQVKRTMDDFGESSQLVDPCYQVSMADTATGISGKSEDRAQAILARQGRISADGEVNSGGVAGSLGMTTKVAEYPFSASVGKRISRHLDRYCSVSEASAGYCTLSANGMQGGDTDFSVHLAPGKTYGWDQVEAASDFVKTIAPVTPMPTAGSCTSLECQSALADRRTEEAMLSMTRYSMVQFVESRSTQASGDAKKSGSN